MFNESQQSNSHSLKLLYECFGGSLPSVQEMWFLEVRDDTLFPGSLCVYTS